MDITLESLTGKPMGAELEPPFIALQVGRAVITAAADIHLHKQPLCTEVYLQPSP